VTDVMATRCLPLSGALACMAGQRNKLTGVDIDAHGKEGEHLLEDMQSTYGRSRFIVCTKRWFPRLLSAQ